MHSFCNDIPGILSQILLKERGLYPGWCGSVDWVPTCEPKVLGSQVQFPVRAHAWVAGQVPSRGCVRGNHILMLLSLFLPPFLPLSLKINKYFF